MGKGPELTEVVGATLIYRPLDRSTTSSSEVAFFKLVTLPLIVGAVLAVTVGPEAGGVGLVAMAGFLVWQRRRTTNPRGVRLTVEGHRC